MVIRNKTLPEEKRRRYYLQEFLLFVLNMSAIVKREQNVLICCCCYCFTWRAYCWKRLVYDKLLLTWEPHNIHIFFSRSVSDSPFFA